MVTHIGYIFSFAQNWATSTAFWLFVIRSSSCVPIHGLSPVGHTSRCDFVCSSPQLQVIFWSPYPHFRIFSFDRITTTRYSVSSILASLNCVHEVIFPMILSTLYWPCSSFGFSFRILLATVSLIALQIS